jgi:hypothetical protein
MQGKIFKSDRAWQTQSCLNASVRDHRHRRPRAAWRSGRLWSVRCDGEQPLFYQARRGAMRFLVGLRPLPVRLLRSTQQEGIITVLVAVRPVASAANIQSNTPTLLQHTQRLWRVLCEP